MGQGFEGARLRAPLDGYASAEPNPSLHALRAPRPPLAAPHTCAPTLARAPTAFCLVLALVRARAHARSLALARAPLAGAWVLGAPSPAAASPFDPEGEDWEGLSQLVTVAREEVGLKRLVLGETIDLRALRRQDTLVLVHPTGALDVDELSAFLRDGGRLVLLDDYGRGDVLLARYGIRRVPLPSRPAEVLRGNPALPIAEPASAHPAVQDVGKVVINHGTGVDRRALAPLLVVRGDAEPDVVVAVAGSVGRGRLLAVGDASIAMNMMMRYPGNRAFARGLVRYATEPGPADAPGGGNLYLAVNDVRTVGTYRGDSSVGGVERAVADAFGALSHDGLPAPAAYLLALAVGLGVVAWTTVQAGRPHRPVIPRFVRRTSGGGRGGRRRAGRDAGRAGDVTGLAAARDQERPRGGSRDEARARSGARPRGSGPQGPRGRAPRRG